MVDKQLAWKHFRKALGYYFDGSRKAIKEARAATRYRPEWSRPHWLLGTVFMDGPRPDIESAIREYREVTRLEPGWAVGHYYLGDALFKQGRVEEAMGPLREALRLDPDNQCHRVRLAECLLKRNDYREAITVLRGKPSLSPHYTVADAYLLIAEAWIKRNNRLDLARPAWEFVLALDETIPAYRMAKEEARRRLAETAKP
ncbi:MAG TPA: tetratricopeptide repeat protein [Pyrinomonadaceae bacterium]|jgi:tetratricopeptide (TPR) repeat protein